MEPKLRRELHAHLFWTALMQASISLHPNPELFHSGEQFSRTKTRSLRTDHAVLNRDVRQSAVKRK